MLLGDLIPRVKDEVIPIIDENIEYWINEKSKGNWSKVRNVSKFKGLRSSTLSSGKSSASDLSVVGDEVKASPGMIIQAIQEL